MLQINFNIFKRSDSRSEEIVGVSKMHYVGLCVVTYG